MSRFFDISDLHHQINYIQIFNPVRWLHLCIWIVFNQGGSRYNRSEPESNLKGSTCLFRQLLHVHIFMFVAPVVVDLVYVVRTVVCFLSFFENQT